MQKDARYYRARIRVINSLIAMMDSDDPVRVLLRNGVFPDYIDQKGLIREALLQENISSDPLSFQEICSFNTWFSMHPDKIAGKELITSFREFPITIKGSKEEIIETINQTLLPDDFNFSLQLKKKSTSAKLKLLSI